ncbi:MAG TPA: tetratricopeptide repeat protein [Thermoanaerobaculia bacterium]|nr:tetratricopeptide repeat protein [Thermoanaerobaculia bacterium]
MEVLTMPVNILRQSMILTVLSLSSLSALAAQPSATPFKKPPAGEILNLSPADAAMTAGEPSSEAAIFAAGAECPSAEAAFAGDPNEDSADLADRYRQSRRLIASGQWSRAKTLLEASLAIYPDSRNLHQLYAELLWYMSDGTNRNLLKQAAREAVRAAEIGLGFETVDPSLTRRLAEVLGRTRDKAAFEKIFNAIRKVDDGAGVRLEVARGLRLMKDSGTEAAFHDALDGAEGELAMTDFGEWLLDQRRDDEVLSLLPKNPGLRYIHLLRGVALERLGRMQEARGAYVQFANYSRFFPAPARFRIPGSTLQAETGIRFQTPKKKMAKSPASISAEDITNITAAITDAQAEFGLSYMIYGEAVGESVAGKRGAGWLARDRVLRGSVGPSPCPYVVNSGATLADQYKSVLCQGNGSQFNGMCLAWCSNPDTTSCPYNAETDNVAFDVYEGTAPDPVSDHCPGGFTAFGTGVCDAARTCVGARNTYRLDGPVFNYGTTGTCPTLCAPTNKGKVCGNGGRDNCFYANAYCPGTTYPASSNSLSGTGAYKVTPATSAASGTHFGHLDGPDSQDFDLILETASSSAGPWSTYTSSAQAGSTEEVKTTAPAGWYRWKVLSYSGSGSFTLCAKHP